MDHDKLQEIYEFANEVLETVDPEEVDGAINWGDLTCTDVCFCKSVHGSEHVSVTIEEADPHNPDLRQYMYERLTLRFPDVGYFDVQTEW